MPSEDFWITLLQSRDVTVTGVTLTLLLVLGISMRMGWLVTGGMHAQLEKTCDNCQKALLSANDTIKQCERDYNDARIVNARLEERELLWRQPSSPPRRRGS